VSRLFISHSSRNDDWAIALRDWLVREGWSGENDIFLDLDPERGIVAGQRWARALEDAATRCEAVLFLVSEAWLASKWCFDEYQLAKELNKKLFALLIDDVPLDRLPGGLTAQWQVVNLRGEPAERFLTVHPRTQHPSPVHIAKGGLASLKRGLEKAGIGAETFELQTDANGPFGWRAPYRGLEALEPEDAAVFFGRNADMVRGIDALRGLAAHKPPRLLVILGASGAGKSSFLRAGLWPRLLRDDSQWLPLKPIRAGRDGAIEGGEGLLTALEDVHARFALRKTRAALREKVATPAAFVALLNELRQAAARRAHLSEPPYSLPILCLDQGEELFAADAGAESTKLLAFARVAIEADAALLLMTIRSDAYGGMQSAEVLAEIEQVALPLGPVPQGEVGRIIREPSEVLRRKAGPQAPVFDPAVVEQLQQEIAGEADALPLLAFVLQRLMREHHGAATIGVAELERTGGVAAAIEREAEAALADAGYGPDRAERRDVLRRLFIPRLCRIDRESKAPQRRVARQSDLPSDLAPLARALTQRRLLVARIAGEAARGETGAATLEVAHEALLRRWPTLADLLAEDRDALLMLDGALMAATDWEKADVDHKQDFLAHRGSRLADTQALAARGPDWAREIAPAQSYLAACAAREAAEREEKEAALSREQARLAEMAAAQARTARLQQRGRWTLAGLAAVVALGLGGGIWQYWNNSTLQDFLAARQRMIDRKQAQLLAGLARNESTKKNFSSALKFAVLGVRIDLSLSEDQTSPSATELSIAASQADWRYSLSGHNDIVSHAVFSRDGSRIATSSWDGTVRIWDGSTGAELIVMNVGHGALMSVAFSPDGTKVVAGAWDNTARVFDVASGKEIAMLAGHDAGVWYASFSPDGSRVVTASWDKTARVWDVATAKQLLVLRGHTAEVHNVRYNPSGTHIVTASEDHTAKIWDAASGEEITTLRGHDQQVMTAAFSPDGQTIVTASFDNTARIWEVSTGREKLVLRGHQGRVSFANYSPDGMWIVTSSMDRTARIWDVATGKELMVLHGHEDQITSVSINPEKTRLVTSSRDHTVRIWDAAGGNKQIGVLNGHTGSVMQTTFSPDGSSILTSSNDNTARIWDATTMREKTQFLGHTGRVPSAVYSPDGSRIATAANDQTARIWDAATGKELMQFHGHDGPVVAVAFSPDGNKLVTGSEDKSGRLWDVKTGKEIAVLKGHENRIYGVAFSPDGSMVATASWDKNVFLWDATTGAKIGSLEGHVSPVHSVAFSPDGKRIVTASWDDIAWVWDAATRKKIAVLRGHEAGVISASFNRDGSRVITASEDKTVRIWEATTGQGLMVMRGHDDEVWFASFSPDGLRAVSGSVDRTARVWDTRFAMMSISELLQSVCTQLLGSQTKLTREEMRLAFYSESTPEIDVCTYSP
jgi:WD40 repeat protein